MAEALVGGAFLAASLQVLFDRLASREVLNLFSKRETNVDSFLNKLKRKLNVLSYVLDDADAKQFTSPAVKEWLDEAKDAVFEADDLLGEVSYEALRCKVESVHDSPSGSNHQVTDSILCSSPSFDAYIEPKLDKMVQLLEDLIKDAGSLGLRKGVRLVNMSKRFSSSSLVALSDVYGRNQEKQKLIKLLLPGEMNCDNNEIGVIPIVAMGGMGKTTLAQVAYNDEFVGEHFEMKAWVCISQEFDILRVTNSILESITKSTCSGTDLNQVQGSLKEQLNGRRFLLVLDDVWNENYDHWDILRAPFKSGASGSRIIVTSRSQKVASIMSTGVVINLPELSDDDCWSLFAKTAFRPRQSSDSPLIEEIGRKIVKRCRGLPLAVKSLGGLLRSKCSIEEWDDVLKSGVWDIPEDKSDILPSLRLSYHYLPSHLKQCFAFCSLFPKNYIFREDRLVSLWIAEKFVLPRKGKDHEMEGKKCFHELLSMSFFQRSSYSGSSFVMHDLIHDLAEFVSGQFSFRLDLEKSHEIPKTVRHFSYCVGLIDGFRKLQAAKQVNSLRTFLPINIYEQRSLSVELDDALFSAQKKLRVLSLVNYKMKELPDLIGTLIHLHYLDLSFTNIKLLPESICGLYNLDTLLLVGCWELTALPVEIGKLCSLRRLDIWETKLTDMPIQMRLLKGLEYLSEFVVGKCSGLGIDGLKALCSLRGELKIWGLENTRNSKEALEAKLKEKNHLEKLELEWGWHDTNDSRCEREVLDYLRPHSNLKELIVTRYGGTRFPDWLGDHLFSQMVHLCLLDCKNCLWLPPLGQLPCLKELVVAGLSSVTEVGQEFYGICAQNPPFPSLEVLRFLRMSRWVDFHLPGVGEFSKLSELHVIDCPKLVGALPENIYSMRIIRCPSLKASIPSCSSSSSRYGLPKVSYKRELILRGSMGVEVNWQGMSDLVQLEISDSASLRVFTIDLCALTKLKLLTIRGCPNLLSLSDTGLPPMLLQLEIDNCDLLQSVVDGRMLSSNRCALRRLTIRCCPSLVSFAENGLPLSLETIIFMMCPRLGLPKDTRCCPSVRYLELYDCLVFKRIPMTLPRLFPNLETLLIGDDLSILYGPECSGMSCFLQPGVLANLIHIRMQDCKKLESLPEGLHDLLPSLRTMELVDCPEIESFGQDCLPSSLFSLVILRCEKMFSSRSGLGLHRLNSLKRLNIYKVCPSIESFPEEGMLPSTLDTLHIGGFPNMMTLNWRGFQHLTSLRDLLVSECPQIQSLPEEGLPTSILNLTIRECPLLTPRCQKDTGDYWGKIAHIPCITLDAEMKDLLYDRNQVRKPKK